MAFISNDEINNIRARANIVDIVASYIPLTQRGRNYICVCPFHDDHSPSMSVSAEKQIYKCFACGATGNVFTFVAEYENVSFIEAVGIVAQKSGIDIDVGDFKQEVVSQYKEEHKIMELANKFYQNNLKTKAGEDALKYLTDRGISEEVIKSAGIGLSLDSPDALLNLLTKKNYDVKLLQELGLVNQVNGKTYDVFSRRITFPLWDKDGNIVGFSARIYRGEKDASKYMNSKETKIFKKGETLYNYHNAKDEAKRKKEIVVVEGFMDAIRLMVSGVTNVVALQGTAMTTEQISLLKKLRAKVILCLDNDNAGLLATANNGEELVKNGVETFVIRLSGEKDPDEYIVANGKEAFLENLEHPLTFFEFKMNYLKQNKDLSKVEDLADYVNAVLKDLGESNDPILREVTLSKLSQEYNLSMDVLKSKLDKKEIVLEKKEEIKKEDNSKKDLYAMGTEKILFFMMNGEEYVSRYQQKLGYFAEEKYRNIANEIVYYLNENGEITVADFITYIQDKDEIKSHVMEIVNDSINDEVTMEAMDDYILAVSKVMTKNEINRLKVMMKKELDVDKKMKYAAQIAELKKRMCE